MNIEHFALNVRDPVNMAEWYVKHLGMKIVKKRDEAPFTTFLTDTGNNVQLEIYCNPEAEVPDYHNMNPLIFHLAFTDNNLDVTKPSLIKAGAEFIEELRLPNGSRIMMMRDPWGLPIQFCKRN